MKDNIDDMLFKYYENNKQVPIGFTNKIKESCNMINSKKLVYNLNMQKKIMVACLISFFVTGVVLASNNFHFIRKIFNCSTGINTAIDNGYICTPETQCIVSENTNFIVDYMLMDDINLNLSFLGTFPEELDVTNLIKMHIPSFIITDETNTILFANDQELINEFCKKNSLNFDDINKNYYNTGYSFYIDYLVTKNMNFKLNISGIDFPQSKKLHILFKDINISDEEKSKSITLKGCWNIDINVPEKFYTRENTIYTVKNCNYKNVDLSSIEAVVYQTGMKFKMSMNNISSKDLSNYTGIGSIEEHLAIKNNAYVENDKGEKFYITASSDGDGGYGMKNSNTFYYWQTFNITSFNLTDNLKVVLEISNGEKIIINLEK